MAVEHLDMKLADAVKKAQLAKGVPRHVPGEVALNSDDLSDFFQPPV